MSKQKHSREIKVIGKYYLDRLYSSHLDFEIYRHKLRRLGWVETTNPAEAHLIISSSWKHIQKWIISQQDPRYVHRRLALWTQEPYHDYHTTHTGRVTIHNVYTGTVFKDNYRYFRWSEKDKIPLLDDKNFTTTDFIHKKFPLLVFSTKYSKNHWSSNTHSLLPRRYEIIEYGLKYLPALGSALSLSLEIQTETNKDNNDGKEDKDSEESNNDRKEDNKDNKILRIISIIEQKCKENAVKINDINENALKINENIPKGIKIWGKGWAKNIASGESRRASNRRQLKHELLKTGLFNIAFESVNAKYYVTEKIWESIRGLCLPIYWSNETIYQDFPKESFIDARLFYEKYRELWCEKLFEYIENMSYDEYVKRMNMCITVFNNLCQKKLDVDMRRDSKNKDLHFINYSRNWDEFKSMFN